MRTPNPYNYNLPVEPEMFFGRQEDVETLAHHLTATPGDSFALIGGRRMGKTSLLEALLRALSEEPVHSLLPLPVFLDLTGGGIDSTSTFFHIVGKRAQAALSNRLALSLLDVCTIGIEDGQPPAPAFSQLLESWGRSTIAEKGCRFRLILLLDECEQIVEQHWSSELYGALRYLLVRQATRSLLKVVMTGSHHFLTQMRERGSPLRNVLQYHRLCVLDEPTAYDLVTRPTEGILPGGVVQAVIGQSGGHPFLTQYLMHHLWERGLKSATPKMVRQIAASFPHERTDFREWMKCLGDSGLRVYKVLAEAEEAITESKVRAALRPALPDLPQVLDALCYHGLVVREAASGGYRVAGDIFREWFVTGATGCFEKIADRQVPSGAEGSPPVPSLGRSIYITHIGHAEGIAIGNGSGVEQRESASTTPLSAPPSVSVSLLTCVVPTACCHHLDATTFPLVSVALDSTGQGCTNAALRISATVEGYSDTVVASPQVTKGEQIRISLLPLLKPTTVATLNEIRPATLHITIEQTTPTVRMLYDQTERIELHARDTALLALRVSDGSIVDLTDYLAAWVTPHRFEIERLLRQAAEHHPDRQFIGYQGASTLAEGTEIVRVQAQAIFTVLKQDANLTYVNSPVSFGVQAGQIMQRVRLPTESLAAGSSANCIDGTVLFASLLELAAIDPFIVVVPGHAFVGWRIWQGVNRYEFLETTMIGSDDFGTAQQSAQLLYEDALLKGNFSRGLFDPGGFARLIDVRACRAKGIYPLE